MRVKSLLCALLLSACSGDAPSSEQTPLTGLRVDSVLGEVAQQGYLRASQPRAFEFPQDHGAHPGFRTEWWYLTATLTDAEGAQYGVQFTLFKQALSPQPLGPGPWQTGVVFLAHLAVTDVEGERHHEAERFARGHPELAGVRLDDGLLLYIDDWSVRQPSAEDFSLILSASQRAADGEGFGVSLQVKQVHPIVLQGQRGLSMKSEGSGSYYYSMPRLQVSGDLVLPEGSVTVDGLAWLDREWSTSVLPDAVAGWDWFALHLDDGRSIMAFRLRREDGLRDAFDHGILVADSAATAAAVGVGDPGVQLLGPRDYELIPQRFWSDTEGNAWPVGWTLRLGDEVLSIAAMVDDQRMDTSVIYWEGIVTVRDDNGRDAGRGYMELTGYAD